MSKPKMKVFISYAWESPEYKDAIWDLSGWIQTNSDNEIEVITDHLFENRPPEKGWQIWMQDQIDNCDFVLLACTQKYRARFEKRDDGSVGGAGVTAEGAIITQELYNQKLRNNKFFPILPDGGDMNNIPTLLQPFNNNHFFPSGNERILKLIYGENPTHLVKITSIMESVPLEVKNGNFEKEIVEEIIVSIDFKEKKHMLSPVQMLVRSYLSLDDMNKNKLCRIFGLSDELLNKPADRDKEIFKIISSKEQISKFWDEINFLEPFEIKSNPFLTAQI